MDYEWDRAKAAANFRKHRVAFTDAALFLEDPLARTMADPDASGAGPNAEPMRHTDEKGI